MCVSACVCPHCVTSSCNWDRLYANTLKRKGRHGIGDEREVPARACGENEDNQMKTKIRARRKRGFVVVKSQSQVRFLRIPSDVESRHVGKSVALELPQENSPTDARAAS